MTHGSRLLLAATSLIFMTLSAAAQTVYIHAGALLDRPGEAPRGESTIVVRDGRIDSVRDGLIAPPTDARLIDLSKQFVLPGLIDMHVHIFNDDDKLRSRMEANNRDYEDQLLIAIDNSRRTLEAGFTTLRELGADVHAVTALRDAIANNIVPGPTIVPAGRMISITAGHGDPANSANRDIAQAERG